MKFKCLCMVEHLNPVLPDAVMGTGGSEKKTMNQHDIS